MGGNNPLAGLSDAHFEHESVAVSQATEQKLNPLAAAFMGHSGAGSTTSFAEALGGTSTATVTEPTFGTETFANALESQTNRQTESITPAPEFTDLFGLAQQTELKDQATLLALRAEIEEHKANLATVIAEAKAQDPLAATEETKILMAQETGTEGLYLINFLHQITVSLQRATKMLENLITLSAGKSASWLETRSYHNRQRDEMRLTAQAAG